MNNITSCADLLAGACTASLSPEERSSLFDDAEYHRQNLTDGIAVMGELLENYAIVARCNHRQVDIGNDTAEKLGRFLMVAAMMLGALNGTISETMPSRSQTHTREAEQ
ncbi:hypothetical protein [Salmonella enterica]|uniref:hypothetical protein n=1 Tax=Salmonella enterica TaxID=28901 RepID=UPI0009AFFB94|nr:hypothetical protein [Salmonella enterica]